MKNRIIAAIAATALLGACSSTPPESFASADGGDHVVRLVQQPWEDLIVENQIVSDILGALGYQTQIKDLSVPLGAQALATGQADAYLGNWWPSQESTYKKYLDSGDVRVLGSMVTGTRYAPAVPDYVAQRYNIRSLADLSAHGADFGQKILGIEPGTPGNQYILDAIQKDVYGLGTWQLVESSTPAMLAEVDRLTATRQPVVFLAWSPHWMNVKWKLVYLEDPQHIWPGAGEIRVLTRKALADDDPNVTRFLSQIKVDTDTASTWIDQYGQQKMPAEEIAKDWLRTNQDVVATWLDGVKSVDGEAAAAVVKSKLG
ncbi:ABC transporter substrate-binding protein [Actinophytocola sp.]|uniref:ABC transporter substrate-binding protein n=1 Tax=Actinophytocola sp. TaxID=1872138 RepID=UPI002ED56E2E